MGSDLRSCYSVVVGLRCGADATHMPKWPDFRCPSDGGGDRMESNGEYRTGRRKDAVASEGSGFGNNLPVLVGPSDPMIYNPGMELPLTLLTRECLFDNSHKSGTERIARRCDADVARR